MINVKQILIKMGYKKKEEVEFFGKRKIVAHITSHVGLGESSILFHDQENLHSIPS